MHPIKKAQNVNHRYITSWNNSFQLVIFIIKTREVLKMSANVETMFYTREKPWHGLGTKVSEAPDSKEALELAGLDWKVISKPVYTSNRVLIPGYKANIRNSDQKVLGVVTDRYKIVQNEEAFAFTDALLGEGVRYETAGSLQGGRKIWLLAKLPNEYIITGERITPYLVFSNSHDGTGAIKVAMTPIRVVCQNTLNLALASANRSWSAIHTGDISNKLDHARNTLSLANHYMENLGKEFERLSTITLSDHQVADYMNSLIPLPEDATQTQLKNVKKQREDLNHRYYDAPDLQQVGKNAYRLLNAVSDYATHSRPLRETANYKENLFSRTIDGNPLIGKAYQLIRAAA